MNNTIIQSIIQKKKTCYFVSPHFDDAVFSAGSLLQYLSTKTKVVVVNVFTKGGEKPYTLSAKVFLNQCNYKDADKLFIDRENEDAAVLKNLANKVINLGFVDALWREKTDKNFLSKVFYSIPELQVMYPTYRFHVVKGAVAKQDERTISHIRKRLSEIITQENTAVFCPLATGNHIDHVITRLACEKEFTDLIYWSDFPYNLHATTDISGFDSFEYDQSPDQKRKLIQGYISQYNAMFKAGLTLQPEAFYLRKK